MNAIRRMCKPVFGGMRRNGQCVDTRLHKVSERCINQSMRCNSRLTGKFSGNNVHRKMSARFCARMASMLCAVIANIKPYRRKSVGQLDFEQRNKRIIVIPVLMASRGLHLIFLYSFICRASQILSPIIKTVIQTSVPKSLKFTHIAVE